MSTRPRARFLGHPIHPMLVVFPLGYVYGVAVEAPGEAAEQRR